MCQEPVPESPLSDCNYGLLSLELANIRPNYEAMVRSGHLKPTDMTGTSTFFNYLQLYGIFQMAMCFNFFLFQL